MWREGIVEAEGRVIRYQAKVYEVGSRFGINGGRVSKLLFLSDGEVLLSYDRGWGVKPTCEAAKEALAILLAKF